MRLGGTLTTSGFGHCDDGMSDGWEWVGVQVAALTWREEDGMGNDLVEV